MTARFAMSATMPRDDVVLVEIRGDLDQHTVPRAREFLSVVTTTATCHLVVDLADVRFLDPSGLALLISAEGGTGGIHGSLHLLGVVGNHPVERPLTMVGLTDNLSFAPCPESLLVDLDDKRDGS
jgi:anti-anti-sigma factor